MNLIKKKSKKNAFFIPLLNLHLLFTLILLIIPINSYPFCHITCAPTSCDDHTSNRCIVCGSSFIRSNPSASWSSCIFDGAPL